MPTGVASKRSLKSISPAWLTRRGTGCRDDGRVYGDVAEDRDLVLAVQRGPAEQAQRTAALPKTRTETTVRTTAQAATTARLRVAIPVALLIPQMSCRPVACRSSRP